MEFITDHIKRFDKLLLLSSFGLVFIGLLSIYSSSISRGDFSNFEKQIAFFAVGVTLMLIFSFLDWRIIRNDSYLLLLLFGIGVIALLGLLLFAPEIRGIKGWYKIGGISIDPIEYMKIVLVVIMAKYFSKRHFQIHRISNIFFSWVYFSVPTALIFLQPDLGAALLMMLLWIFTLLVSGIRIRQFFGIISVGLLTTWLGWLFLLQGYQKDRLISFIKPELDPLGIGWSQLQAKIAIGSGGLFGQGIGNGTQTQYGFLSEPHTDFIFAAIAEEMGFIGVIILIALFLLLIFRILKIGLSAQSNFPRLFAAGISIIFMIQFFINIGMNLGLLPIIGLPLPLVSYGGSALITNFIALGILQSIQTH